MDNDLLKHIEDFMSGIDDSWSEFKKSRYIFKNLGLLYNYDPQYIYSGPMIQNEILKEAVKNNHKELVGINEDEVIQEFVNIGKTNVFFKSAVLYNDKCRSLLDLVAL